MDDTIQPTPSVHSLNGTRTAGMMRTTTDKLAEKCPKCREVILLKDLSRNLKVCQRCGHHFRMSAEERIELLLDPDGRQPFATDLRTADPLNFVNRSVKYPQYVAQERQKTGLDEAAVTLRGFIDDLPVVMAILDFAFIGGTMGSVVGEKIALAAEMAGREHAPLIVLSASGGARMYEGMYSLLQMAKTSAALARLAEEGVPFISVLTDPTLGGTSASFAFLGDVILAEPGALVGFAGPRVIEGAIHVKLPPDADTSEFVLAHGMIDGIVHRRDLRTSLGRLVRLYQSRGNQSR